MTIQEVAITCCLNDTAVSATVWDVHTGTNLITYRGDTPVAPGGISLLAGQYVVAALQDKPFLRVWPVNSQQPLTFLRLVCPGRVSHAQASPDGCYVAVTVAEKLHLYQVASGRLVGSGVRHFQPIRVLRWSSEGNSVVCGGDDGIVTVWLLSTLAASQSPPEPYHVMSDHSLPVTDLIVTAGSRPRLLSVSADRTCKIYDLTEGNLLVSLVFDSMLTAVTTSTLETDVFVGTNSGAILQWNLLSPPRNVEYHLTTAELVPVFTGHTKAVRTLSASFNSDLLMSGSADGCVKIWHISSHQCLRTITLKGPVTNAFFAQKPKQIFENELKPSLVINSFLSANNETVEFIDVIGEQSLNLCDISSRNLFPVQMTHSSDDRVKSLQMNIDLLKSINSNLYKFSVDKILVDNRITPLVPEIASKGPAKNKNKRKMRWVANKNKSVGVVRANNKASVKKDKNKKANNNNNNKTDQVVVIHGMRRIIMNKKRKKNKGGNNTQNIPNEVRAVGGMPGITVKIKNKKNKRQFSNESRPNFTNNEFSRKVENSKKKKKNKNVKNKNGGNDKNKPNVVAVNAKSRTVFSSKQKNRNVSNNKNNKLNDLAGSRWNVNKRKKRKQDT